MYVYKAKEITLLLSILMLGHYIQGFIKILNSPSSTFVAGGIDSYISQSSVLNTRVIKKYVHTS